MHYIVGLGNPGEKYDCTRHNVGFSLLQHFVQQAGLPSFHDSGKHSGVISEGVFEGQEIAVLLPTTFMNDSGSAVKKLVPKEEADKLLVVYDDIDIPVGEIKVSYGRGDGGHNGIKSIIESLGTKEFARLRVGIGGRSMWTGKPVRPKGDALASYVLKPFSSKEAKQLEAIEKMVKEVIAVFVTKGKEKVMNSFN